MQFSLLLLAITLPVSAARFSLSHSSLDGGGGTSWAGRFTVESSLESYLGSGHISLLNDPPLPKKDFLELPQSALFTIPISSLLDNDRDLEGNASFLSLVETNTPGGGTVTLLNGIITYTAPLNPGPRSDFFSYVLTDDFGAAAAGKVVLLSSNSIPRLTGIQGSRTSLVVRFRALPDTSYLLQSRPNLDAISSWLDYPDALGPQVRRADANGELNFEIPLGSANRFFRAADLESLRAELTFKRTAARLSMTLRGIPNTLYRLQFRSGLEASGQWLDYPSAARPFIVRSDNEGFYQISSPITSSRGFFRTVLMDEVASQLLGE